MNDVNNRIKQGLVEELYSRKNIRNTVKQSIMSDHTTFKKLLYAACITAISEWLNEPAKYDSKQARKDHIKLLNVNDTIAELFIAILTDGAQPIQAKVSKLAVHLGFNDEWQGITAAGELIGVCVDTGLYDVNLSKNESMSVIPLVTLDEEVLSFIEQTKYLPPMVSEPVDWIEGDVTSHSNTNIGGGQLTLCNHVVLGAENNHGEYQAVNALNIMQSIPLSIDTHMVTFSEEPKQPHINSEAKGQFDQMVYESTEIYQEILDNGNEFYSCYQFDFRGRLYSAGYHLHIQASEYKKSLINLAHEELIN